MQETRLKPTEGIRLQQTVFVRRVQSYGCGAILHAEDTAPTFMTGLTSRTSHQNQQSIPAIGGGSPGSSGHAGIGPDKRFRRVDGGRGGKAGNPFDEKGSRLPPA